MKYILSMFLMVSINFGLIGQIQSFNKIPINILDNLDKMGCDSIESMNKYESLYFNIIFCNEDFDFTDKKIAFVTGSSGKSLSNKCDYFNIEKKRFKQNSSPSGGELFLFDEDQKIKSGGYDGAILYWSKVIMQKDDILKLIYKK